MNVSFALAAVIAAFIAAFDIGAGRMVLLKSAFDIATTMLNNFSGNSLQKKSKINFPGLSIRKNLFSVLPWVDYRCCFVRTEYVEWEKYGENATTKRQMKNRSHKIFESNGRFNWWHTWQHKTTWFALKMLKSFQNLRNMASYFRCMLDACVAPSPYYTTYIRMSTTSKASTNACCTGCQSSRLATNWRPCFGLKIGFAPAMKIVYRL